MTKHNLICFDNGGETFDRYTILNTADGEMIGASDHPFHPQGFGQFCGNVAHNYWVTAYGAGWRRGCDEKILRKRIKYAVERFLSDCEHIGRRIDFDFMPDEVQRFAAQSFEIVDAEL